MAVFAVSAADFICWRNDTSPHRSRGALRNRFPLEGSFSLCGKLLIDLRDQLFKAGWVGVAGQFGLYASRMYGRSTNATRAMPAIEGNGEKNVLRLRAAICNEGFIRRALKIRILQIDVRVTVTCRGQVDQPTSGADQRCNPVH